MRECFSYSCANTRIMKIPLVCSSHQVADLSKTSLIFDVDAYFMLPDRRSAEGRQRGVLATRGKARDGKRGERESAEEDAPCRRSRVHHLLIYVFAIFGNLWLRT